MTLKQFQLSIVLIVIAFAGLIGAQPSGRHGDLTKTYDIDAKGNISGDIQILTDADGGAYALKIRVQNLSKTNDVMLELTDIPQLWTMISIHDHASTNWLSKPRPILKPYEYHPVEMRLGKASTVEWFVRLSDRLIDPKVLPDQINASLSVRLGFRYRQIEDQKAPQSRFDEVWLEFYYPNILITRKALEGNPTEKYEKSLKVVTKP